MFVPYLEYGPIYELNFTDAVIQVCFLGFNVSKKRELVDLANGSEFRVVSLVTENLNYLVVNENADTKKIEEAESRGIEVLSERHFVELAGRFVKLRRMTSSFKKG